MLHKHFELKAGDGGRMVASTPGLDRDNDRVLPMGAKLDNFLKNPVLMYGHNYRDPWALIGKVADLMVEPTGLTFAPALRDPANDADPMNVIKALWDQGWLRACSIGFNVVKWMDNEMGGKDFVEWELLEISLVPIPANQNALRLAAKAIDGGEEETFVHAPVPEPVKVEESADNNALSPEEGELLSALGNFLDVVFEIL